MGTAVIKQFDWIRDSGIWVNYKWDPSLPSLGRINVIYGPNGSGKSSLAGALDGLRNAGDAKGHERVSITIADNSSERNTNGLDDPFFDRVHVFGEHYVARSHRFTPAEAEMQAVLTIGEKPVEKELKIEGLRKEVDEITAKRKSKSERQSQANRGVESAFARVSQQVVDAVGKAGGRWRSRSNFSVATVRAAFRDSRSGWATLSDSELQEKVGVVNSGKSDPIPEDRLIVKAPDDIARRLQSALAMSPASLILDTLSAHPEATPWVDEGRHLHEGVDVCMFCGASFSQERRWLIDQHFSNEVERVQAELRSIGVELRDLEALATTALAAIPKKGMFFEDLRTKYEPAFNELRDELIALRQWSIAARARAETKAFNVLASVPSAVDEPPTVSGLELMNLRSLHNHRVAERELMVQAAAQTVELHYLKSAEEEVEANSETAQAAQVEVEELGQELARLLDKIAVLENAEGDPSPSAKVLTAEVARLLGRNELQFEAVDGKYRVSRDGQPALGLSMGERTAITLVHFLESVARFPASKGKPIVVIDDPVSSLDSNIFMGLSTYIWVETVSKDHIGQVILLTHDFELFRQWDVQIEGLPGSGGPKSGYPASLYEIRSSHTLAPGSTKPKRRPCLVVWPSNPSVRKKMRSTYLHSFMTVARALQELQADDSIEHRLDAQLLFPNVVRRLLETFLAFKRPDWVGDFTGAMRKSKDLLLSGHYVGDADALRLRLTRYAHAHSHSETPATNLTVSPDEVMVAIGGVFEFMNCLDAAHFSGLCKVVGIEPGSILPAVPAVTE